MAGRTLQRSVLLTRCVSEASWTERHCLPAACCCMFEGCCLPCLPECVYALPLFARRDWKQQLGGHSITNLLLEMDRRGLVRAEVRKDGKGSGINVFYSRVSSRSSQAAAKPADARARERPPAPAAQPAGSRQLDAAMPPGSSKEALLVQAVAEQNSRQPGQALAVANLGEVLRRMDR